MVAIPTFLLASSALSSLSRSGLGRRDVALSTRIPSFSIPNPELIEREDSDKQGAFGSVLGPLISSNFPDPGVIWHDGLSYAFATNNRKPGIDHINVQIATSSDNKTWTLRQCESGKHTTARGESCDALPDVAKWQTGKAVWAPDVIRLKNGKFIMYYSDLFVKSSRHHCIGAAISDKVDGPYVPYEQPFACPDPDSLGGAIDPEGFFDESTGKRYVIYKIDGNSNGHGGLCSNDVNPIRPTPIMLQEVKSEDGVNHVGDAVKILDRDAQDGPLIEAPAMYRSNEGIYFLFYSPSCFTTPLYATAYATATKVTGPYTRASRPLLATGDGPDLVGPGGMDILPDGMVVFHGHMTVENDKSFQEATQAEAKKIKKPVKDVHLPLIRGMYSGVADFNKHEVSLRKK